MIDNHPEAEKPRSNLSESSSHQPQAEQLHPLDRERGQLIKFVIMWCVTAIVTIFLIGSILITILVFNGQSGNNIVTIVAVMTSAIGVIGTIIGSIVGHAQGASGREIQAKRS